MNSIARIGAVLFSGLSACCLLPQPRYTDARGQSHEYPKISAQTSIEAATYELAPVHPGFAAQRLYYVPERREWIVFADRFAYRYNLAGDAIEMVADNYRFGRYAERSGVSFRLDGYCDWILTGDATSKPYRVIENGKIADDELEASIRTAEDYQELYDIDHTRLPGRTVALKVGGGWMVLPHEQLAARWDSQQKPPLRGMKVVADQVVQVEPDTRWNVNDKSSALQVLAFRKTGSTPLLSFNDSGFTGDYGVGYYKLSHRGEDFYFQTRTRRGEGGYVDEVQLFVAPGASEEHALWVTMGGGLYALRKKVRAAAANPKRMFEQQYPLTLVFDGVPAGKGEWQSVAYVDGSKEAVAQDLGNELAPRPRRVPSGISFHWQAKLDEASHIIPFLLDDTMLVRKTPEQLVQLDFDRVEILSLFQRLGSASPITLRVKIDSFDMADRAYVFVESSGQRIALEAVKFIDSAMSGKPVLVDEPVDQTLDRKLQRAKLAKLTIDAVQSPEAFRAFLEFATPLDSIPWERATTRNLANLEYLINNLVKASRHDEAKQAFELFTARLQPHLEDEHFARVQFIAGDMLVVAARTNDTPLFNRIWQHTVGGEAKFAQLTDVRLVFNMACMHARLGNKADLLRWVQRALAMGKGPDQFRSDPDFAAFSHDADFLKLLTESSVSRP